MSTTVPVAPAADLAPRVSSNEPSDHLVPTGREEAWRFAPVDKLRDFFEPDVWGSVTAEPTSLVRLAKPSELGESTWDATERVSAIAQVGAESVVLVDIPAEFQGVDVVHVHLRATADRNYGRVEIRAAAMSKCTVVIHHDASSDVNGVLLTTLGDGADLTVLNILDGPRTSRHLWHMPTRVGRDSRYIGLSVTLGGAISRMQTSVEYEGSGGSAEILGAFLALDDQYQEFRIFVDHNEPHCSSSVIFKGALSGESAHTVWVGDVLVRRNATGIDTYEVNRNLLLNDGPRADSVPNLELETGDVVAAGHASATGRFDDEQLFYLESRGIPDTLARQLVVRGFFVDVLARIPDHDLRANILARIEDQIGMSPADPNLGHQTSSKEEQTSGE